MGKGKRRLKFRLQHLVLQNLNTISIVIKYNYNVSYYFKLQEKVKDGFHYCISITLHTAECAQNLN